MRVCVYADIMPVICGACVCALMQSLRVWSAVHVLMPSLRLCSAIHVCVCVLFQMSERQTESSSDIETALRRVTRADTAVVTLHTAAVQVCPQIWPRHRPRPGPV